MAKSKAQYFYTWYATSVVVDNYPHVDSAVLDDRPIDPVYRFPNDNIYAISLSGIRDIKTNYDDEPTAKQLFGVNTLRPKEI